MLRRVINYSSPVCARLKSLANTGIEHCLAKAANNEHFNKPFYFQFWHLTQICCYVDFNPRNVLVTSPFHRNFKYCDKKIVTGRQIGQLGLIIKSYNGLAYIIVFYKLCSKYVSQYLSNIFRWYSDHIWILHYIW